MIRVKESPTRQTRGASQLNYQISFGLANTMSSSHLDHVATDNDPHDSHDLNQDTNNHPGHHLALDLSGALADRDDDADTASQHSISFTSSSAPSPHDSPNLRASSVVDTSRHQSQPYAIPTQSLDDPDDTSLHNGVANSVSSHGGLSLDEDPKPVPPTPFSAALRGNVYPPVQARSPGRSSVASFATSTSSYSRKVRPESLLIDPPKGPLVLGIALVDFNHQVRCRTWFT